MIKIEVCTENERQEKEKERDTQGCGVKKKEFVEKYEKVCW
jgi:hypothetical protein